jgi:MFS transporter, DHA3 family, tetracycline resistance protein
VSGAGFWGLAGLLLLTMPEQGYRPAAPAQRHAWQGMRHTLRASLATIRGRAALCRVLVITVIYGMSSEALSRLTPLHLLGTIGLPSSFAEATWFGILQAGSLLGGAVVTWRLSQTTELHKARRIMQILLALTVVMLLATLLFALARVFWLALLAVWMTRWMRIAMRPLVIAWANRGLAPGARATVLSMFSLLRPSVKSVVARCWASSARCTPCAPPWWVPPWCCSQRSRSMGKPCGTANSRRRGQHHEAFTPRQL